MLLFLTVKNTIRVVDLFNAPIALCCPDHWFLVTLNDLLRKDLKRRGRNCWRFDNWRWRHCKTLIYGRLISLKPSTPFYDLIE